MTKLIRFFLMIVILTVTLQAQATIFFDDYLLTGEEGDTLLINFGGRVFVDVGQPGENNWDFTDVTALNTSPSTFVDITTTPFADLYPDAIYCQHVMERMDGEPTGTDIWLYSASNGDTVFAYGESIETSNNIFNIIFDPARRIIFPLNYLDSWSYTGDEIFRMDNNEDVTPITIENLVDAYGTLTLPNGKVVEALRYVAAESRYFGSTPDVTDIIMFLTKGGDIILIYPLYGQPITGLIETGDFIWFENPVIVDVSDEILPVDYVVKQNFPNPFNPSTNIEFTIPKAGLVKLKIYNSLGEEIFTLFDEFRNAGTYRESFNPESISSGVYFARFTSGEFNKTIKMTYLK